MVGSTVPKTGGIVLVIFVAVFGLGFLQRHKPDHDAVRRIRQSQNQYDKRALRLRGWRRLIEFIEMGKPSLLEARELVAIEAKGEGIRRRFEKLLQARG